ncbi:MAG TPA: TonB-dependent receptor [Candidatus Baltobacteraceae bacterium]|nr:TonB-dependent receptor [Candidatus Baltobacteraceae bacterium]
MSRTSTLAIAVLFLFLASLALPQSAGAQAPTTGTVNGTVQDETGAPVASANVTLKGATTKTTTSDPAGKFSMDVTPGSYVLSVTKAGYTPAIQNDVIVLGGQTVGLSVRLSSVTFSSLRTIANVRTTGHALNTSAASVSEVTTSTFIDQAQPQVTRVLSQIPGLQISFPSNSANAAAPGAITVPNIRAATSYETASLIDGHYISVGQYGDNVTTFLNSFMFGGVEVVKGPGADAPQVNNAIGGTTNFRTKDPTATPYAQMLFGFDNHGGTLSNFDYSDTVGRLGFVVDVATDNNQSALFDKNVYYDPSASAASVNGTSLTSNSGAIYQQVGNTQSYLPTSPQMLACCWTLQGSLDQTAELVKLRYKLSSATRATFTYLAGQTTSDQNGNTSNLYNAVFTPGPGYTGPIAAGSHIQYSTVYPGASQGEFNNEPILEGEIASAIGNDSVLARYYNATISRYQWGGLNPSGTDVNAVTLYGTNGYYDNSGNYHYTTNFNGTPSNVQYYDYYQEPELDKLQGESFQYDHPFADGNDVLTFSGDWTAAQSTDYSMYSASYCTPLCYSFSLPPGTHQQLGTYMLRGHFSLSPKLAATLTDYFNTYSSTYAVDCPMQFGACTQDADVSGTGVKFQTTNNTHNDPRLGLVYRPTAFSSVRFSAGSSIAPPFLGVLSQVLSPPTFNQGYGVAFETNTPGNVKPETGFGYDLGGDVSFRDGTIFSADVYMTNLFNRFFQQTTPTGLTCGSVTTCVPDPSTGASAPAGTPILNEFNTNISNARFEGIEATLSRAPTVGLGFTFSGALQKGYYYDLPPNFYCSAGALQPGGCIPANYDQNLNIISGQNTNGIPVGFYSINYNGNMRIPFAQGNAELNYTFPNQIYVALGETYYGKNNSLNEPPFGIGYATLRFPVNRTIALQISGDNIFNAYPGFLPVYGAGVPIDLANGTTAATNGNVLGPATWRLMIMTRP